ncbi:TonB-dependent receptor [Croceibacterium mercuriale]|uniref:TonB-dependent receptor n=1 Tax=Croceibacterium mercuriale TaxID=1572751 RepID=A0A0B2BW80_9SPHN|nr:TonB-dependent receptor [Croceibacterium mercuriale]KHL25679.1 TonB-dependent receptor [Croceibacterium mercuriale]
MRRAAPALLLLLAIAASPPAAARGERVVLDVPAGTAGQAAIAIARQSGTSVVIADPALAARRVRAVRGRHSAQDAVRRLASAIGGQAIAVGAGAWRIVPHRDVPPATRPHPRPAPPPPAEPTLPITVVASKRDLSLADFAGQVAVLDGRELTFGGVGGTERITQALASVSSTHLGSGRNKLFIRGMADSSFTGPTQATVGQYLGDLRLGYNAPDPDLRLSDLARVEVLEGPQGTLYGAGSLGGIIRLVPNVPQLGVTTAAGRIGASVTWHGEPGVDAGATLNLPLASDSAALRLVVDGSRSGGYIDKPLIGQDDVNRSDVLGGRATIRVEMAPGWTVDLMGIGQRIDAADSQYADRIAAARSDGLERDALVTEGSDASFGQGQLVVSGWIGSVRLRSTTGLTGQELSERYDATRDPAVPRLFVQHNDTRMFAHETRLWQPGGDSFGWLAGISYTSNRVRLTRALDLPDGSRVFTTGVTNRIREGTIYGEGSLSLMPGLTATAGARLTHSELGGEGENLPLPLVAALRALTGKRTETVFLPSAALLARLREDTTLYLRYQQGFRPGGLAIESDIVRRFEGDSTATFELGARHGTPRNGPFDLAASLSFTDWHDIQADFIDASGFPSTANIGDGRVWTATLSGSMAIGRNLRLEGGLSLNDSRVQTGTVSFLSGVDVVSNVSRTELIERSRQVPNIADISGRAGFDWSRPVGGGLDLTARGWVSYVGRSRLGIGPELGARQGDYLDSGLAIRLGRDGMGLTLGITNIPDTRGNRFALGTPFVDDRLQVTPLRPRTVRLGFEAAF